MDYCKKCQGELECIGEEEMSLNSIYRCRDCSTEYVLRTKLELRKEEPIK